MYIKNNSYTINSSLYFYGFSLIELMVVIAIIAILATISLPSNDGKINRARIQETIKITNKYRVQIENYYYLKQEFPFENSDAGLPEAEDIMGNYLESVHIKNGVMHLMLGKKITNQLSGNIISIRPIFVPGVDNAPISWVCGYSTPPEGMIAAGENKTNVDKKYLPSDCL